MQRSSKKEGLREREAGKAGTGRELTQSVYRGWGGGRAGITTDYTLSGKREGGGPPR